ncbi:MAG TPA: helix-turn-helix domain-containing protein [Thermoanaerobaculia bacterium]|nr:helix-turn-helix domain-containing protein [Thermoanaerobaculia bacterium]
MEPRDLALLLSQVGLEAPDLTEQEIALLERVSVRTVQGWRRKGGGPPFRKAGLGLTGAVRYPVAEYRKWRDSRVVANTAQSVRLDTAKK